MNVVARKSISKPLACILKPCSSFKDSARDPRSDSILHLMSFPVQSRGDLKRREGKKKLSITRTPLPHFTPLHYKFALSLSNGLCEKGEPFFSSPVSSRIKLRGIQPFFQNSPAALSSGGVYVKKRGEKEGAKFQSLFRSHEVFKAAKLRKKT